MAFIPLIRRPRRVANHHRQTGDRPRAGTRSTSCSTRPSAGSCPRPNAKQIRVSREISVDLPPIEGDPKRLQQVLGNVLSNAIEFTPEAGCVTLTCQPDSDGVLIEVRDSGAGIAPEFLLWAWPRARPGPSHRRAASRRHSCVKRRRADRTRPSGRSGGAGRRRQCVCATAGSKPSDRRRRRRLLLQAD